LTTAKAMRLNRHNTLAQYLTISAYGTVLVAATLPQPVVDTFYPPFAVVDWSFVGLACYMYGLGFYFTAITISQDTNLRHSIRHFAIKESKLLDNIGTAQMEQEIQRRVLKIAKEQEDILKEQTGVEQSAAFDEHTRKEVVNNNNKNNDEDKKSCFCRLTLLSPQYFRKRNALKDQLPRLTDSSTLRDSLQYRSVRPVLFSIALVVRIRTWVLSVRKRLRNR
jgi:hypothetical protein